jgi:hypothetical protein
MKSKQACSLFRNPLKRQDVAGGVGGEALEGAVD